MNFPVGILSSEHTNDFLCLLIVTTILLYITITTMIEYLFNIVRRETMIIIAVLLTQWFPLSTARPEATNIFVNFWLTMQL